MIKQEPDYRGEPSDRLIARKVSMHQAYGGLACSHSEEMKELFCADNDEFASLDGVLTFHKSDISKPLDNREKEKAYLETLASSL